MPQKSEAEKALEAVEQGQKDREARQQAEAKAKDEAARTEQLRLYHERHNAAMALVRDYETKAQAFDAKLAELSAIVEAMSRVTLAIQTARESLAPESRALGDTRGAITPSHPRSLKAAFGTLNAAWMRGQA